MTPFNNAFLALLAFLEHETVVPGTCSGTGTLRWKTAISQGSQYILYVAVELANNDRSRERCGDKQLKVCKSVEIIMQDV